MLQPLLDAAEGLGLGMGVGRRGVTDRPEGMTSSSVPNTPRRARILKPEGGDGKKAKARIRQSHGRDKGRCAHACESVCENVCMVEPQLHLQKHNAHSNVRTHLREVTRLHI